MQTPSSPAASCVYTIRHLSALGNVARTGYGSFTEAKTWRSGSAMLAQSQAAGTWTPIFFAAADRVGGLLYVARLDRIEFKRTNVPYTKYHFSQVRRLGSPAPPLSSLRLLETGEPLSCDFIRPYALCHTPTDLVSVDL
jgi:hypothetical protein